MQLLPEYSTFGLNAILENKTVHDRKQSYWFTDLETRAHALPPYFISLCVYPLC